LMRKFFTFLLLWPLIFGVSSAFAADDPSEQFLDAYMAVQQSEKLEQAGKLRAALSKLKYAATTLDQIREKSPTWQPVIVDYRRKKTGDAIVELEKKVGAGGGLPEAEGPLPGNLEPPLPKKDETGNAATTSASL